MKDKFVHPYIPNSVPEVKAKMMEYIGIKDIEELYEDIPQHLRFQGKLNLPDAIPSEYALKRHVEDILLKNCSENIVSNCTFYNNAFGIEGYHAPNNIIKNSLFHTNHNCIFLENSNNNSIDHCTPVARTRARRKRRCWRSFPSRGRSASI